MIKMKSRWLKKRRGDMEMGKLFLVFLLIIFGLALTPTIGDAVWTALHNSTGTGPSNITGAPADLLELIPLIWVFIVIGVGAAAVVEMFEDM